MTRKFLIVGLTTAFCVAGFSETSEAGHHHRRAHKTAGQNCGAVQPSSCATVNTGCSTCSSDAYSYPSGQSFGATSYGSNNYGNSGVYGNYGMPAGQGYINANAGGNLMGGRLLGR